jgi:GAF domain-containing protein
MTDPSDRSRGVSSRPALAPSREQLLADVFVHLADTLVAEYDVVEVLDHLVRACVDTLGCTAAGLLLSDQRGHLTVMASSAENSRLLEIFQIQNDEGPCLVCFQTGQPVSVPDLAVAIDRWPRFVPVAIERGFRSVHALPMRLRDRIIGALNLFHGEDWPLSDDELRIAQALADTATIGILQQRALQASSVLAEQLQSALNSRVTIEQAKGVLAAYGSIDMDQAFQVLRWHARNNNLRLTEAARDIATRSVDPNEVLRNHRPH